ncbi:MAG: amidohydrolase family protein [Saprospiraceae bacterium]|nr:amidohydrolase family protein [Saprospiraceae bacterium]
MNTTNNFLIAAFLITVIHIPASTNAQQVQKAENGVYLLTNATLHTITHGTYVGHILLRDGKIADISKNSITEASAKVIDCTNKHIYPGMIDSGSKLGLVEIDAVSVTNDFSELGDFIPHMKALTAVNPNAVAIPVTRVNGVTTVFVKPEGSIFSGTGAMIDLFGYTPEQMSCGSERLVMRFPSTGRRGRFDRRSEDDIKKDAEKSLKNINEIWESALSYARIDSAAKAENQKWITNNPQMEALKPVVYGTQPLFIEVNAKADIESALQWISEKKIKAVLMGVAEGWRVADKIVKAKIPVITGPVLSTPRRDNDRFDAPYSNAGKMAKAGIKVALRTDGAENTRNLPFNAAFAATYGMGKDEALKAITIYPAEIFGIADKYGSLDKGKTANLFVATGDPFEMKTKIEKLFIRGWDIPLESRQTLLNDEFLNRTPGIK